MFEYLHLKSGHIKREISKGTCNIFTLGGGITLEPSAELKDKRKEMLNKG